MRQDTIWLILLIVIVILILFVIFYKNFNNVSSPQTLSSQPLRMVAAGVGELTALTYPQYTGFPARITFPTIEKYVDYAVFVNDSKLPNQYFNFVPNGSADKVSIQNSSSGLYLSMFQLNATVNGIASKIWVGSFSESSLSAASIFQVTRMDNSNSYTFGFNGLFLIFVSKVSLPGASLSDSQSDTVLSLGSPAVSFSLFSI